ncbi:MAG: selD [Planctomycetaceae bacterium]|nr:selD [Planctomycetaceae bacterium]
MSILRQSDHWEKVVDIPMHYPRLAARDLVLIGAGHTNLHVLRQWRMRPIPDVQLTLVTPFSKATYSGMLPGTLAGLYRPAEMQIDLYRFTAGTGIRLIIAEATGLAPEQRRVTFDDRPPLRFDVASIGIGSVPNQSELWQRSTRVLSIKPMATFLDRLHATLSQRKDTQRPLKCVVVGSGAAGTEVAFCLDAMFRQSGIPHSITLLDHHAEILPSYTPALVRRARKLLAARGIEVRLGQAAKSLEESSEQAAQLILADGTALAVDFVVWATSARPPIALQNYTLPKDVNGFLSIRPTLQTTADAPVFVVGDTASFNDYSVPKAGVYAVREGPILWENIQRFLSNRPLVGYRPQTGFMSLLSTGDGQALLQYHGWTAHGKWVWRLKDYIDRKFMRMYQDYQSPMPHATSGSSTAFSKQERGPAAMHCGGCGCKVGANLLSSALRKIRESALETAAALSQPDDAFVIAPDLPRPDVMSVDFFRSFLDDPYQMGRIGVLHALSDIWAMGARPTGVQALITLPYGPEPQQAELLYQLLAGSVRELAAHGVSLWGGHTIEGPELQLGFSAAGHLAGAAPWRKSGLLPGDVLILTKPLGTGVLLAAHQQGKCQAEWMNAVLHGMLLSNARAAEIARQFPIHAATDVTGFGLAGHLLEMLAVTNCAATLGLSQLDRMLWPGFAQLVEQGIQSTLAPANREVESQIQVSLDQKKTAAYLSLFDPQTSGGLLFGVAEQVAPHFLAALTIPEGAIPAIVGRIIQSEPGRAKILIDA